MIKKKKKSGPNRWFQLIIKKNTINNLVQVSLNRNVSSIEWNDIKHLFGSCSNLYNQNFTTFNRKKSNNFYNNIQEKNNILWKWGNRDAGFNSLKNIKIRWWGTSKLTVLLNKQPVLITNRLVCPNMKFSTTLIGMLVEYLN